ncbi:AraC family transcriptional regulator [uncultured Xanthomonas sp.]|uniref:AraC family transcriptional regulator n=1 Tax=uncultured Xanthomonas sp. TaxID=152831 RepID=UPI0025DBAA4F|nr:AraC family transcriptional regulator [uncultured Xanthomonas sp.]
MFDRRNICRYRPDMTDALSDILTLVQLDSYGFRGLDAGSDWGLRFPPADGIRCFAIDSGECRIVLQDAPSPIALEPGDVILVQAGAAMQLYAGAPVTWQDAISFLTQVPPGHVAELNGGGVCRGIGGFFSLRGQHAAAILSAVPPVVHIRSQDHKAALQASVRRLIVELREPRPGSDLLAGHLAQALLIEALRAHLETGQQQMGWLAALGVPALHRALTAMHANVSHRWTVAELAAAARMSRSSFAAHFERVTGETPMDYLTRWRMALASHRLLTSTLSVGAIGMSVGYSSESAFAVAFKRNFDASPSQYRAQSIAAKF